MHARFLLGPAGSGKTFRCLADIRAALGAASEGRPLLLVAPKQTTYQIERELLMTNALLGYTQLHILSFERLAGFVFDHLKLGRPEVLDEEGRLMVLRALLARHRDGLQVFRASARLTGFSAELSNVLQEFQRQQLTSDFIREVASKLPVTEGLGAKLHDLATLMELYSQWLAEHELQDAECLLDAATKSLVQRLALTPALPLFFGGLWVDGFAEYSTQELELLLALAPVCEQVTVTFCLPKLPAEKSSWLSSWSVVENTFRQCRQRFDEIPAMKLSMEVLARRSFQTRFENNPVLRSLEARWDEPGASKVEHFPAESLHPSLRMVTCKTLEAEVTLAAREILRHVRAGGRYRDVAVLVRKLQPYNSAVQRIFARYEIPFFMDRREPIAHHPFVELTRSALRTVVMGWKSEDLFAALKTGLIPVAEEHIDRLENEALARGWDGNTWLKPIVLPNEPELNRWLNDLLDRLLPCFQHLAVGLAASGSRPTGPQLAEALRRLWRELDIEEQLNLWSTAVLDATNRAVPESVHSTVWDELNKVLENVELAFRDEAIPAKEWLAILEAGFANLTVGVIPPALDQVLVGGVDRSRNPDIKLALVLGLNETVFPALPETGTLLTDTDRALLERQGILSNGTVRHQLSRERYYAYLACTRARERLVLTSALHDSEGGPLNPSPFLAHIRQLFPLLESDSYPDGLEREEAEHLNELIVPLLKAPGEATQAENIGAAFPALAEMLTEVRGLTSKDDGLLSPGLAQQLYGPVLRTSVSRLEQFAACPFRFFVHSGLRAEERKLFELDVREQGSFQHDALALFHSELRNAGLRWRDISPAQARERMGDIAKSLMATYRDGLLQASEQSRFMGGMLSESLKDFVETLVEWMGGQYQFDPVEVELPFGEETGLPAHEIDLENGNRLALKGRIDRVDIFQPAGATEALCVVVDYKSSQKQLEPILMENGLQLQLLTYLNMLRQLKTAQASFPASGVVPAGVFYVSLRGKYERKANRNQALEDISGARKQAYQHTGRFDISVLPHLDARMNEKTGDQFVYRLDAKGVRKSREAMAREDFQGLLDLVEANLKRMGVEIFAGVVAVSPFRKGSLVACTYCDYRPICRMDASSPTYRLLKRAKEAQERIKGCGP